MRISDWSSDVCSSDVLENIMSLKHLFLRTIAVLAVGSAAMFVPAMQARAADRYVVVDPAQPSDTSGKIEVLEFFAYTCPHCNAIEPLVQKWAKTLPDNVDRKSTRLNSSH